MIIDVILTLMLINDDVALYPRLWSFAAAGKCFRLMRIRWSLKIEINISYGRRGF